VASLPPAIAGIQFVWALLRLCYRTWPCAPPSLGGPRPPRGVHERTVSQRTVPARMRFPPQCVESIFRSSGGGAARKRRRRPVPAQYHTAVSRRKRIPEQGRRTNVRLTRSSAVQLRGRMHTDPVSYHGAEQGSTPVGCSTSPLRQRRRERTWWYGPGPALPRGPSVDGLKTDSTGDGLKTNSTVSMDGGSWPGGEAVGHVLTKLSAHEPLEGEGGMRPPHRPCTAASDRAPVSTSSASATARSGRPISVSAARPAVAA